MKFAPARIRGRAPPGSHCRRRNTGRSLLVAAASCCFRARRAGGAFAWYKFFREKRSRNGSPAIPTCASSTARSVPSATPASPTGSSTCCRGCFPDKLPGPAATPPSAWCGKKARSCRSAFEEGGGAFRAWPTTARPATPRATAPRPMRRRLSCRLAQSHAEPVGVLPLSGRLRERPTLQRRQPDGRDQSGHRPVLHRPPALSLRDHPDHAQALFRARTAVRLAVPRRFPAPGAAAATMR